MANSEHLAKLKEGGVAWNRWRKDNPQIRCDLAEANLTEAGLSDVDLRKADLGYASLKGAVLKRTNLTEANLFGANLRKANLTGADLRGANLRRADLAEANLAATNFTGAGNLEIEQLCQAATLYRTQLDQMLEKQAVRKCPHLLEAPRDESGLEK